MVLLGIKKKQIRRIVLARPAVEAGEKLGFLPGDLQAKVNPYLRPLFDALVDMMDFAQMKKFMELDNHSLRLLLTGGDKLHLYIPRRYELYNNYGPTENTVVSTSCKSFKTP